MLAHRRQNRFPCALAQPTPQASSTGCRTPAHSAIYLLIAGSYTPFTLVTVCGRWGWSLFGVNWELAALGITQELTLGRRTCSVSMVLYVLTDWLVLVAIRPLIHTLPATGATWLVAGGVIYSAGIYFFINDERVRHGHGIWHLFVRAGSLCSSSAWRVMSPDS